ncbi:MAG TPA: hypothetical protein VFZ62_01115 [Candidatus Saccharimonadales bacterium]
MAEKKTWEQMTRGEKAVGLVGIGIIILLAILVISGIASAFSSAGGVNSEKQAAVEPATTHKDVRETESVPFEKVSQDAPRVILV